MAERPCKHCGLPMFECYGAQKYHRECAVEVNRLRTAKANLTRPSRRNCKRPETYDIDTNGLVGWEGLAQAVVEQAIADWRYLCDDGTETADRNFLELEQFFKHESRMFIRSSNDTEKRLWEQMQEERRTAGK